MRLPSLCRLCIHIVGKLTHKLKCNKLNRFTAIGDRNIEDAAFSVALSQLSQLEELEFFGIVDLGLDDPNRYSNLPLLLSALPSPSSLSIVKIASLFQGPQDFVGRAVFWDGPDAILSNSVHLPKLKALAFETRFSDHRRRPRSEEYEKTAARYWPAIRRAGVRAEISDAT
jgi:hypothetical protein